MYNYNQLYSNSFEAQLDHQPTTKCRSLKNVSTTTDTVRQI